MENFLFYAVWDIASKNVSSKIFGGRPLKNLKWLICLIRQYPYTFFKDFLIQIQIALSLNTLTHKLQ